MGDAEGESLLPTSWKRPSPGEAEQPCGPPPLTPFGRAHTLPALRLLLLIKTVGVEAGKVQRKAGERRLSSLTVLPVRAWAVESVERGRVGLSEQ